MKLSLYSLALFCLCGNLNAASVAENAKLSKVCAVDIYPFINGATSDYVKATVAPLYKDSVWVRNTLFHLNANNARFITEAANVNARYQGTSRYVGSPAIRDNIAASIQSLKQAQAAVIAAQLGDAASISAEINAVISVLESARTALIPFMEWIWIVKDTPLSSVFPDESVRLLQDGILRASKVLKTVMSGITSRVISDSNFRAIAFSLDFVQAATAANRESMNVAVVAQTSGFESATSGTTTAVTSYLNGNIQVMEDFRVTIVTEFNAVGSYAQGAIVAALHAYIKYRVSAATFKDVYTPLAQDLLTNLEEAYILIHGENKRAIKDLKELIDSPDQGENGSKSSLESNASPGSNNPQTPYTLKGELKKIRKRARGLVRNIQRQYSKSTRAPACGGTSIVEIQTQVSIYQNKLNECVTKTIANQRTILSALTPVIKSEVDKMVTAFKNCVPEKRTAPAGSSAEAGWSCRVSPDLQFFAYFDAKLLKLKFNGEV